jgi:hypothetical protein
MFDEPASLPMRAAIASLLGGLFGIALILTTHSAQAQTAAPPAQASAVLSTIDSGITRLGEAALQTLRATEPLYGLGNTGVHAMRLSGSASEPASGLRWQMTRLPWLRSEGEIPRSRDLISLGLQVRF